MIKCVVAVLATTHTTKERAGESSDSPARSSFTLSRIALIAPCELHRHGVPTIAKIPVLVTCPYTMWLVVFTLLLIVCCQLPPTY